MAQESALFAGSLRFNLDPFSAYEDADIWDALRRVQMAPPLATPRASRAPSRAPSVREGTGIAGSDSEDTVVEGDERYAVKSLEMAVTESGKNFSAGERQLLALARGILKLQSSSILILDESTASLGMPFLHASFFQHVSNPQSLHFLRSSYGRKDSKNH